MPVLRLSALINKGLFILKTILTISFCQYHHQKSISIQNTIGNLKDNSTMDKTEDQIVSYGILYLTLLLLGQHMVLYGHWLHYSMS